MNHKSIKINSVMAVIVLLLLVGVFTSCEKYTFNPPAVDPNTTWHLSTDIQPIFDAKCVSCHGGTLSPNLSTGKAWNSLTKGGYVTAPAESSTLYTKVISSGHTARTSDSEKLKILYWIEQGAQNN